MVNLTTPLDGMLRAQDQFEKAAGRMARASLSGQAGDSVDLSNEAVALLQSRNAFESNVKTARVEDEMTRTALNLMG